MRAPLLTSFTIDRGTVIAGKYRVERTLGRGGMGIVVAARHLELHETVALKMLLPSVATNPIAVARFGREARASVKIKSPHVARTMDIDRLDNGLPFIVMEYLEGESLAQRLRRSGPLPIEEAVEFVVQATHAVAEAHNFGIVHRDLKPANLFVVRHRDGSESVKVLDFGISKLTDSTGSMLETLTQTTTPPGSPPYMAPEQLEDSSHADFRVDIWSLGITLFELLAGVRPFGGKTLTEVCLSILGDPLPKLRRLRPEIPPGLEAAIGTATAKRREERFPDVGALALALSPFCPDGTRHLAELAARMADQSGEHAIRHRTLVPESLVATERLSCHSIPPPPERQLSGVPPSSPTFPIAEQVTRTAPSEAVTRTSVAALEGAAGKGTSVRRWWLLALAAMLTVTLAAALGLRRQHPASQETGAPTSSGTPSNGSHFTPEERGPSDPSSARIRNGHSSLANPGDSHDASGGNPMSPRGSSAEQALSLSPHLRAPIPSASTTPVDGGNPGQPASGVEKGDSQAFGDRT